VSVAAPVQADEPAKTDSDMSGIDMDLEDKTPAADFKSDSMPNIWTIDEDRDEAEPHHDHDDEPRRHDVVTSSDIDEEIEKPSFLRRLAKRVKENPDSDKTDQND
jgi:hypothetical protein